MFQTFTLACSPAHSTTSPIRDTHSNQTWHKKLNYFHIFPHRQAKRWFYNFNMSKVIACNYVELKIIKLKQASSLSLWGEGTHVNVPSKWNIWRKLNCSCRWEKKTRNNNTKTQIHFLTRLEQSNKYFMPHHSLARVSNEKKRKNFTLSIN